MSLEIVKLLSILCVFNVPRIQYRTVHVLLVSKGTSSSHLVHAHTPSANTTSFKSQILTPETAVDFGVSQACATSLPCIA